MDWLRDPIWQFFGAIVGVITIVISYIFFKKQQKQKNIAYEIISSTDLLNVNSEVKSKLHVLFEQKPVEKLSLLVIRIYNAGNEPILATDFEKPIFIEFGSTSEVLEVGIDKVSPNDLQPKIERTPKNITLQPLLLNGGDAITLKILLASFDDVVDVKGRIAGVKHISGSGIYRVKLTEYRTTLTQIYLLTIMGTFIATSSGAIMISSREIFPAAFIMVGGILIVMLVIVGITVVYDGITDLMGE